MSNQSISPRLAKFLADFQEKQRKQNEVLTTQTNVSLATIQESPSETTSQEIQQSNGSKIPETLQNKDTKQVYMGENQIYDKHGNLITLNSKQSEFVKLVLAGNSCILIGAAGTGKTTAQKAVTQALFAAGMIPSMNGHDHKYLPHNSPGISISAYTRRATNNIRRNMSEDLQGNCITIHKLLEYAPIYYEITDPDSGKLRNTMRFEATRNALNHLPKEVRVIVLEEASMISVELFREIEQAVSSGVQFIFLGDIQQLPPVFGSAILGFKMLELPVIELTDVYRQALDSPIIKLAHRILSGVPIPLKEYSEWYYPNQLKIHDWKKKISAENAVATLAKFFCGYMQDGKLVPGEIQKGKYNPETDAILIPFNKACGSDELNRHLANTLAKQSGRVVWEVIHGFKKSYYSVGDKCLYDREDAIIQNIYPNPQYSGAPAQQESVTLNYWGHKATSTSPSKESHSTEDDTDFLLAQVAMGKVDGEDDRVRACSHVIELYLIDSERTIEIKDAGQLNNLILGYAITVHKSQGSEWDKVYLCLHHTHATMMQRELLYTAVTRAKKELYIICEADSFERGIVNQRIKGNTLAEKAEYFKGKVERNEMQTQ